MHAIFVLLEDLVQLMIWAIIAVVVLSWLVNFGVVNARSHIVYTVQDFLTRVTEPVLAPIRRHMPNFGNLDLSPVVAILLLGLLQSLLGDAYMHLVMAGYGF